MAAKKKPAVPRFIPKTPKQLMDLIGPDAEVLVSALSLKKILGKRASKRIDDAITGNL